MESETPTGGKNPGDSYDTHDSDSDGKSIENEKNPEEKCKQLPHGHISSDDARSLCTGISTKQFTEYLVEANGKSSIEAQGSAYRGSLKHRNMPKERYSAIEAPPPPPYDEVWRETFQQEQRYQSSKTDHTFNNVIYSKITEIERTQDEAKQLHQTLSRRMDRIEQRQPQENHLNEGRIGEQVVEHLVQNPRFQSMIQAREVSVSHVESVGNRMENTTTVQRCKKCGCKWFCSCHCHNHKVDYEPRTEGNSRKKNEDTFKRTEKKNVGGNQGKNNQPVKENSSEGCEREMLQGATGGDPEEPPSDDNSSDDGDIRKNNKYKKELNDARRRKQKWVIDAAAWKSCLEDKKTIEAQATTLLEKRKLPSQVLLNKAYANNILATQTLKNVCQHISNYIKDQSQLVLSVWAAYTFTKDAKTYGKELIFVVLSKDTNRVVVNDFFIHQRCINEVWSKEENLEISQKELSDLLAPGELQGLEKCLKENAKSLMNKHSKVTRVTASWYRAGVNEAGHRSLRKELCIVLYVHIKGYVPFNEEPFPTKIGEYPVDVREGVFTLCGGPKDYHGNVKMGCNIRGENQGTLGAFIEDGDRNMYGLTCAHVVFGNDKLKQILERKTITFDDTNCDVVYQPASQHLIAPFGNTDITLYREGGTEIGMEIALIKINDDRLPTEGSFPDDLNYTAEGFGPNKPFVFCSGKYLESLNCFLEVFKYGGESKLTKGTLRLDGASVRDFKYFELTLHNQLEIFSLEGYPFAVHGDSGALILTNHFNPRELSAVGILEGEMDGVCMVTPMYAVLNELRQCTGKNYTIKMFPYRIRPAADGSGGDLNKKMTLLETNVTNTNEKVERIRHDLVQHFEAHKNDISRELQKQGRQTREMKEQQKKQNDEQKCQIQEIKDQQKQQIEENRKQSEEIKEQQKNQSKEQQRQTQEMKEMLNVLLARQNTSTSEIAQT